MLEKKFRAWDEIEAKFRTLLDLGDVSGEGSVQFSVGYAGELQIGRLEEFHNGAGFDTKFTKFPVIQFTSLKDKNSKEIYEGDIVRVHEGEDFIWTQQVIENGGGYWVDENYLGAIHSFCEVIGNIYEHPELLGESK